MTAWRKALNLNPIIVAYGDEELTPVTVCEKVIELLKPEGAPLVGIERALTRAHAGEDTDVVEALFNKGLDAIYDWADLNKIWLGI